MIRWMCSTAKDKVKILETISIIFIPSESLGVNLLFATISHKKFLIGRLKSVPINTYPLHSRRWKSFNVFKESLLWVFHYWSQLQRFSCGARLWNVCIRVIFDGDRPLISVFLKASYASSKSLMTYIWG